MKKSNNIFKKFFLSYRGIPNKKPYVEFLTALLSIPVLLTVVLLNLNTLSNKENKSENKSQEKVFITLPGGGSVEAPCKEEIGPIEISSPQEGETVLDNPVFVDIIYRQGEYCSVVWSYRINGGKWSDYSDNSIALYNPPSGNIRFELRVKSVVSNENKTLKRNFIYKGKSIVPTDQTSSSSAN